MSKRAWDLLKCSREQFQVLRNSVEICKFLSKCAPNMSKRAWDTSKRAWDILVCSREQFQVLRNSVEICKFLSKCAQNMILDRRGAGRIFAVTVRYALRTAP